MIWILSTTGMRKMELANLLVDDVDWKGKKVRVRLGKGQKERWVILHKRAELPLTRYLGARRDRLPDLWVTEEGRRLTYEGVGQDLTRLVERAGLRREIKDVCHIFRRTWAANAVRRGIPRPYIQAMGGWETPQMIDLYTAAMLEEEGAIEAFRDFDPLAHT